MTSATKASSAVTSRYAGALIDLGEESKTVDKIEQDLADLAAMLENSSEFKALVTAPSISRVQQEKALMALAEKAGFQKLTKNFIGVLIQNRRLSTLPQIIEAARRELSKRRGEVAVEVQTAQDLSEKQIAELQQAISKGIGREVSVKAKVEPGLLGGMIVTVGSQMIDDSVKRKLERLKLAMNRQSNTNTTQKLTKVKEA